MCKVWVLIKDNKVVQKTGIPKHGTFVLCGECGLIKLHNKEKKHGKAKRRG